MASVIAPQVRRCFIEFQKACDNLNRSEPHIKRKIPPGAILDQLGRFRLWCGNVGAHRHGKASLDHKLRKASHILGQALELLQNLETILEEVNEIIAGERVSAEDLPDSDSEASEDGQDWLPEVSTTTELAQLACDLAETNTCLMRLSMAIQNPAPHDQFKQSGNIDVTHFEPFDIDHVRGKFPLAQDYLVFRLGRTISRRRQYLRDREQHRKNLERGLEQGLATEIQLGTGDAPEPVSYAVTAPSERVESTVASSLPSAVKVTTFAHDLTEDDYYDDALSQTTYASEDDTAGCGHLLYQAMG
jgi:hypothetical protein